MERKDELTIALSRTMLAHGFAKQSMNALAQLIDVSRATLYSYFAGKTEIVETVCIRREQLLSANPPAERPLTADGYLNLRLNTILLLGMRSPIFRTDLQQQFPDLASRLDAAYANYDVAATARLLELRTAGIIHGNADCQYFNLQDAIMVAGTIVRIGTDHLEYTTVEALLRDYLRAVIRGTVAHPESLNQALVEQGTAALLAELRNTYYQAEISNE